MKKLLFIALLSLTLSAPAFAGIKTTGSGDSMNFDPTDLPPAMKAKFEIMKVKCIKCHTMERAVIAIKTGVAPISGQPFDQNATKAYGIKMMRKPDSNMSKEETKTVVELMNYLLEEAAK